MSDKLRWGVLGTANIAKRRFAPAVTKSRKSVINAIGSRDLAKAEVFARDYGIPTAYGSYQEVIDDPDIEAVYIPLPHALHCEWTIKAAAAGKHVLCEKPIALDAKETAEMIERCAAARVVLMEAFMYRLNPRIQKLKEVIDSGLIGDVRSVAAQFSFDIGPGPNSRLVSGKGGGSLMDVGCYCINVARYVFGNQPTRVLATQHNHPDLGCDMTTSAILDFGDGRNALINCSFESAFNNILAIVGTKGRITMDQFATSPEYGKIEFAVNTMDGKTQRFTTKAVNQFLVEIDHFADCVRGRAQVALDPSTDALANMRVIDAVRLSAEKSRSVPVAH